MTTCIFVGSPNKKTCAFPFQTRIKSHMRLAVNTSTPFLTLLAGDDCNEENATTDFTDNTDKCKKNSKLRVIHCTGDW